MPAIFEKRVPLPSSTTPLDALSAILESNPDQERVAYERGSTWFVGIGSRYSLAVDATGQSATISGASAGEPTVESIRGQSLADVSRNFISSYSEPNARVFGQVGFNYAALHRGLSFQPGSWPILTLLVPAVQIAIHQDAVEVVCHELEQVGSSIVQLLEAGLTQAQGPTESSSVSTSPDDRSYVESVAKAISEINDGQYQKIILSRPVKLEAKVDMVQTLVQGRSHNTPKRTFFWDHSSYQACGFSPELVMLLEDGRVTTEPLAGTRSCGANEQERSDLKNVLIHDPKEVFEHVISVKEAISEVSEVCAPRTTVVDDFMNVRVRGHVQHLGSSVSGQLREDRDGWDAFNSLFPSITASGIPKTASLEAIQRLETSPRELYSGAILLLDGADFFEAALVLRTAFQDKTSRWIQAGAGIISQSSPERELTETKEKLSSIAPYIVYQNQK